MPPPPSFPREGAGQFSALATELFAPTPDPSLPPPPFAFRYPSSTPPASASYASPGLRASVAALSLDPPSFCGHVEGGGLEGPFLLTPETLELLDPPRAYDLSCLRFLGGAHAELSRFLLSFLSAASLPP
ncbi:hypothetical protein TeGR_g2796, partial [Tetraparma gracilis]